MHFHIYNVISDLLPSRAHGLRRWMLRQCGVGVARDVSICAGVKVFEAHCEIASGTWISPEVTIFTAKDGPVKIGKNCDIGHGVSFITGTHEVGSAARRAGKGRSQPIVIGDGSWIGGRAVILGGATIGAGTVVAAGAVVVPGVYPPNSLLAGVPAGVKKSYGY